MTTEQVLHDVFMSELGLIAVVIGTIVVTVLVFRYVDRRWTFIPRKKQRARFRENFEAPTPDFDVSNPINGRRGQTVEICGATWYRMN